MPTIMIKTSRAHSMFHSVIEGMIEVAADDDETDRESRLNRLVDATPGRDDIHYPATFSIDASLVDDAKETLDICLNTFVDDDPEDNMAEGDVVISD